MAQLTGRALIRVDGAELRSEPDATLDIGGVKRDPKAGAYHIDYTEELAPPVLECKVHNTPTTSLLALQNITNATVVYICDNGPRYILRDAFVTDPPKLSAKEGMVDLKMSAASCDEG